MHFIAERMRLIKDEMMQSHVVDWWLFWVI